MKYYLPEFERYWLLQRQVWVSRLYTCGKSQKDLSESIHVNSSNLSRILTGVTCPSISMVHMIESCIREYEFLSGLRSDRSLDPPYFPFAGLEFPSNK